MQVFNLKDVDVPYKVFVCNSILISKCQVKINLYKHMEVYAIMKTRHIFCNFSFNLVP